MPTGPYAVDIAAGIARIDDVLTVDLRKRGRDRSVIRMSEAGDCARRIGYNLLGYPVEPHSERLLGIFAAGHFFEQLLLAGMTAAGMEVTALLPDGSQFEVLSDDPPMTGHFDGRVRLDGVRSLLEAKSANTSRFMEIVSHGIARSNPKYNAQAQLYMLHDDLPQAFFAVINKDTSDIYTEIVPFDSEYADALLARLRQIWALTRAGALPDPEYPKASWTCRSCPFDPLCPGKKGGGGSRITVG